MEIVEGTKKNSKYYIHDDYIYRVKWKKGGVSYLTCITKPCPGRGVLNTNFRVTRAHEHESDPLECEKYRFREELLVAASSSSYSLKKVYHDVAENHQNAAVQYPYLSANTRMKRKRKETHPPAARDLCALRNYLESADWAHLGRTVETPPREFYRNLLQVEDGSEVLVFISPELLRILNITRAIHMDGTFKVVPNGLAEQLTSIHAVYQDKVYPVVYAIMSRRTKAAYVSLLMYIKTVCVNMNPEQFMSDFETAERSAILEVFPTIQARGCWFHFAQAVWKKHRELGLHELCSSNPRGKKILQMCMSLPLLPAEKVSEGICYLQEQISVENLTAEFSQMIQYILNYWIEQVGPHVISVHGCSRRTNNDVENFNQQLFRQTGRQPHPSVWDFIRVIVEMNRDQTLKFLSHENGVLPRSQQRSVSKLQDERIKQAETRLLSGTYTVGEFLEAVSHSVKSLERQLRFRAQPLTVESAVSSEHSSLFSEEDVDNPDVINNF